MVITSQNLLPIFYSVYYLKLEAMHSRLLRWFLFLIIIFSSFNVKSQEIPVDIVKRVTNSSNIFEGRVIRSDSYWSHDKKYIYTSSTIQIYKIFKGDITCGKIEVITDGGNVNDTTLEISHNLVLKEGMVGIFLCNETTKELPVVDFYPENNPLKLDFPYGVEAFIKYFEDGVNKEVVDWQFQLDSLAQAYDLMQIYTTLNLVDCNPGTVILHNHQNDLQHVVAPHFPNAPITMPNPQVRMFGGSELKVELLNRHITSTIPRYFEFDIALGDNVDTLWFSNADITLNFDTNVFYGNVVTNYRIFPSKTGIISNSTAYAVNVYDDPNASNQVVLQVIPTLSVIDSLVNIPSTPTPIVHVALEIVDCNYSSYISMVDAQSGFSDSAFYRGQWINYDQNNINSIIEFPSCGMHIDAVTSSHSPLRGGTGDIVTISGLNFDTARGGGNVFLRNANDSYSFLPLDSTDYIQWSDSLITFSLPGYIENSQFHVDNQYGVAGSGIFILKNNAGDSISGDSITVWFSNRDSWSNYRQTKIPWYLSKADISSNDGYEFRYDNEFSNMVHPDRYNVLDVAIKQWVCLNNVNFLLGDSIVPVVDTARGEGINMIQFGVTPAINILATTLQWNRLLCANITIPEIDIIINRSIKDSLFYSTDCTEDVPANKYDFYSIILHELGHAHSLNHENNWHDIMYFAQRPINQILPGNERNIFIKFDYTARDGSAYVMNELSDSSLVNCPQYNPMTPRYYSECDSLPGRLTIGCSPIGIDEVAGPISELEVYPSPAINYLDLRFKVESYSTISIQIIDILGRKINGEKHRVNSGMVKRKYDISELPSGLYFVVISTNGNSILMKKFIKE